MYDVPTNYCTLSFQAALDNYIHIDNIIFDFKLFKINLNKY